MILSFQRSGTPSLEQTLPPRWQNPAARRMKLSGAFTDKLEGQCGSLALNAAPRRRSKESLESWKLMDAECKRVFSVSLNQEIK